MKFTESFSEGVLQTGWSWVRERSEYWRVENGSLQICVRPGTIWGEKNNAQNVLIRPLEEEASIQVRVSCDLSIAYEQAGLLYYVNDDNYIKLVKERVGEELAVVFGREENAQSNVKNKAAIRSHTVELQMLLSDNTITAQYREELDGRWVTLGQSKAFQGEEIYAGLFSHGGTAEQDNWVCYSGFNIL